MELTNGDISIGVLFTFVVILSLAEMYFSYAHDKKLYKSKDTYKYYLTR